MSKSDAMLRWAAEDKDDLLVVSAAIQDGVVAVGNIKFDRTARTFTLVFNRFRWELPDYGKGERVPAALRFDSVLNVQARGMGRANPDAVAVLLAVEFIPDDEPPGGALLLSFAGDGEIRITAECIDVTLLDLARPRGGRARPDHDLASD